LAFKIAFEMTQNSIVCPEWRRAQLDDFIVMRFYEPRTKMIIVCSILFYLIFCNMERS